MKERCQGFLLGAGAVLASTLLTRMPASPVMAQPPAERGGQVGRYHLTAVVDPPSSTELYLLDTRTGKVLTTRQRPAGTSYTWLDVNVPVPPSR